MVDLSQIIQTVIAILLGTAMIAGAFTIFLYQGRKRRITVVKKRVSEHVGLNQTRSREITVKHYIVECRYENSDKIHNLGCDALIYGRLKEGKSYTVKVKIFRIEKIHYK